MSRFGRFIKKVGRSASRGFKKFSRSKAGKTIGRGLRSVGKKLLKQGVNTGVRMLTGGVMG